MDAPDQPYDALLRSDRKRRNQRLAAGVVGIAVFVAAIWIVTGGGLLVRTDTPVVPGGDVTGPAETGPAVDPLAGLTPTPYDPSLAERWSGDSSFTGAGAYSFLAMPQDNGFHNPSSGMNIYWDLEPGAAPVSGGSSPLAVTLAGHDAIYQRISAGRCGPGCQVGETYPPAVAGSVDLWIIDLGGTKVRITLEAPQDAGAEELEEAYEIIASVQAPPRPDDLVSVTFWVPVGWDSK